MTRDFQEGDVYAKNFSSHGPHWLTGHITKLTAPVSVEVQQEDGSLIKRYFDQVHKKLNSSTSENTMSDSEEAENTTAFVSYPPENSVCDSEIDTGTTSTETQPTYSDTTPETMYIPISNPLTVPSSTTVSVRRNLPRNRKPPEIDIY